jgi:hypothetical protein
MADRLSGDFRIHKFEKFAGGGEGKRKYHCVQCLLHVRSEVKLDISVNSALFLFKKGLVLRNAIK